MIKRSSLIYLIFVLPFLLLSSCNSHKIEGEVISKNHELSETRYVIMPMLVDPEESTIWHYQGKSPILVYAPMVIEDDEDYLLTIKSSKSDYPAVIKVSVAVYNKVHVGEFIKLTEYKSSTEGDILREPTPQETVDKTFEGKIPFIKQQ